MKSSLAVSFTVALFSLCAKAELTKCSSHRSEILSREISYCIQRSRPELTANNEPVIYFMHGLGGNETTWTRGGYSEALQSISSKNAEFPALTFVSFETEMDSFFSDFGGSNQGHKAYETWFIHEFIPFIEGNYPVCQERKCRGLAGVSMGGFGALKFALKYPDLFAIAAANSAALPPFSIHAEDSAWRDYFSNTKIGVVKGMVLLRDVRKIFPTQELYELNDPITMTESFEAPLAPPNLYFDVGSEDNFGFQVGFEIFKNRLDQKNFSYESFIEPEGDHFIYHHRNKDLIEFIGNHFSKVR